MNIDELQAGPELDVMVAEKIFGMKIRNITDKSCELWRDEIKPPNVNARPAGWEKCGPLMRYSEDIAAAWEVIEMSDDYEVDLSDNDAEGRKRHRALIVIGGEMGLATELTASLAICRAALKALEVNP